MEKQTLYYDSTGESGNIFFLLANVRHLLTEQKRKKEAEQLTDKVFAARSYEEALSILNTYVELIDVTKRRD